MFGEREFIDALFPGYFAQLGTRASCPSSLDERSSSARRLPPSASATT